MYHALVKKRFPLNPIFTVCAIENFIALIWLLSSPVVGSQVIIFNLSRPRIIITSVLLAILIPILFFSIETIEIRKWKFSIKACLHSWLNNIEIQIATTISLIVVTLTGLGIIFWKLTLTQESLAFYYEWLGPRFSLFNSLIFQALPVFVLMTVFAFQFLVLVGLQNRKQVARLRPVHLKVVIDTLFLWLIGIITGLHWLVLSLSLTAFTSIPGWHWTLMTKPITVRHLLFFAILAALLMIVHWLKKQPDSVRRNLLLLVLLGYSVQVGMGIIDGKGIESLREKYYGTLHRSYTNKATSRNENVLESIRHYEDIYSNMLFPSTKPPGVMSIYISIERFINAFTHKATQPERFDQLSRFIAVAFPIISLAAVIMLFVYVKRFLYPGEHETSLAALLAPLFFVLSPNIVLFPLFLDQAFYPTLFLAASIPVVVAFQRQRLIWAFLSGLCLYITFFYSFSLLPLLAVPVLLAAFNIWHQRSRSVLIRQVILLFALAGGIASAYAAFRILFNYDFFPRYANAMSVVYNYDFYSRIGLEPGATISAAMRFHQIIDAAILNNLDLASLVGFPIFFLFLARGIKAVLAILKRNSSVGIVVQGALFLSYIGLNVIGQMSGEAGWLWMYWVPVIAGLAAIEVAPLVRRMPWIIYLLITSQWLTLLLTYQFQDLIF